MNIVIFVILALIISANIPIIFFVGFMGVIMFFGENSDHHLFLLLFLTLYINLAFKISILPIIFEIQKSFKMKSSFFWEKVENEIKYKNILLVISCILEFIVLFLNIQVFKEWGFITYILIGGGVLLSYCSLLIWFRISKSKFKTLSYIVFNSIVIIGLLLFVYLGNSISNSLENRVTEVSEYHKMLKEIKTDSKVGDFSFFPQEIPANATNYYFQKEDAFDGYNTHYVKFDIDKAYIDSILQNNTCEILTNTDKINDYKVELYPLELRNADKICILHKSTKDSKYTSGISVYDDTNTIYFFFANF